MGITGQRTIFVAGDFPTFIIFIFLSSFFFSIPAGEASVPSDGLIDVGHEGGEDKWDGDEGGREEEGRGKK